MVPSPSSLSRLLVGLSMAGAAHAGDLTVTVTDAGGKPLDGAVVMVSPVAGRLPVKPMAPVEISQSKRQFQPAVTVITTGTAVNFPNFDTVRHHVYSFAPIKTFELKLYAGVPNTPVVFDKPGVATLGCNIHDQMVAWVVVSDTPLHARSAANGQARLDGVPAGDYRVRAWHPGVPTGTEPATVPVTVGPAAQAAIVKLASVGGAQ